MFVDPHEKHKLCKGPYQENSMQLSFNRFREGGKQLINDVDNDGHKIDDNISHDL